MATPTIVIRFKGKVEELDDYGLSIRVIKKPTESHIAFPPPNYPNYKLHCSNSVMFGLRERFVLGSNLSLNSPLILGFSNGAIPRVGSVAEVMVAIGSWDLLLEYKKDLILLRKQYYNMPYDEKNPSIIDLERNMNELYCQKARMLAQQAMGMK